MKHSIEVKRKSTPGVLCPGKTSHLSIRSENSSPKKPQHVFHTLWQMENSAETSHVRWGHLCPLLKVIIVGKKRMTRDKQANWEKRMKRNRWARRCFKKDNKSWQEWNCRSLITLKNQENVDTSGQSNLAGGVTQTTEADLQLGFHYNYDCLGLLRGKKN